VRKIEPATFWQKKVWQLDYRGCLFDESNVIIAVYIERVNVCTEVKDTFGRWDKRPGVVVRKEMQLLCLLSVSVGAGILFDIFFLC
jgi:hypothetical protein